MELIQTIRKEFGLNERQAQGAVGSVLYIVKDGITKQSFDELLRAVPEGEGWMKLTPEGSAGFFGVLDNVFKSVAGGTLDIGARLGGHFHSLGISTRLAAPVAQVVIQHLAEHVPGPAGRECKGLLSQFKL